MKLTPRQLQDSLNEISEESFARHQELAVIRERSGLAKLELMRTCKNGKEVDMRWAATDDGRRESYLETYLKGLSHKRTALILEAKANSGHAW